MVKAKAKEMSTAKACELLDLNRSTYYSMKKKKESPYNLRLMQEIDRIHTKHPFMGSRRITEEIRENGDQVNRKRVQRLMNLMNIRCIFPGPKTTVTNKAHEKYDYLLRAVTIDRPNQVWSTDITYIPMGKGYMYLCAVMDWYSRRVLSWEVSNTMDKDFCIRVLKSALKTNSKPEIFNTDQGSQFTSSDFTDILKEHGIQISMDGRGRALDNVYIERLWRSVKYENVFLHAYETGKELRAGLLEYFDFYNNHRLHQSLNNQTPTRVYQQIGLKRSVEPIRTPQYFN